MIRHLHLFLCCWPPGDADHKLLELEHFELAEAILNGREIEMTGVEGLKDVAAAYAPLNPAGPDRPGLELGYLITLVTVEHNVA